LAVDIDSIKASNPLEETVARLTGQEVTVRHSIRCPFHQDDTPSMVIYDDGHFHCFGCGAHGDVLDFVGRFYFGQQYDPAAHFQDVVNKLGGLDIKPLPKLLPKERQPEKPKLLIDPATVWGWHETMPWERRSYWHNRWLTHDTIDHFRLGWDGKRYTIPLTYRDVVFGVKRRKSEIDDGIEAKYLMTKGSRAGLFNADTLLLTEHAVVCEGEIDAMLLHQVGFAAVTSTAGAGSWKPHWAKLFSHIPRLTILYDNDQAGRDGALRVRATMRRANILTLPEGVKDVGELFSAFGYDAAQEWLWGRIGE